VESPAEVFTTPNARQYVSALYQSHALALVKLAVLMTGDQPTAEDVVQDAFLGLYRRWQALRDADQWHGQCLEAQAMPVWTDSTGSHVIAFLGLSLKGVKTSASDKFGLVTDGHFTVLPKLVVGEGADFDQGGLAF
jgi:hypothetical protein